MMKKLSYGLIVLAIILIISACSKEEAVDDVTPKMLDVVLTVTPEKASMNENVIFEAKVTYGDEEVTDADEVAFEIWRAQDETHEKLEIKHRENGIYSFEKSFDREGTYYIISHVSAERMHNMPKKEFVIGSPSEPEEEGHSMEDMEMDDDSQ
jgi:hypothetical protein